MFAAEFILGPLHSGLADLVSMFMARENSVTEMVHLVMMLTFSCRDSYPEAVVIVCNEVSDSAGHVVLGQCELHKLVWAGAECIGQVKPQH